MENNYYPVDPNASVEVSRLLRQDSLLNECVSGLFPATIDHTSIRNVLDIGCGPGGWLMEIARRFPHMQPVGLDISEEMIDQASKIAVGEKLSQLTFCQESFVHLPFPDASFDFVNARLVQWFVPEYQRWAILQEWFRVLRPGGWLRFIEGEIQQTNGPATEALASCFLRVLHQMGKTPAFSASQEQIPMASFPHHHGIILLLRHLLIRLGCEEITVEPRLLDFSAGSPIHDAFVQNMLLAQQSFRDVLLAHIPELTAEQCDHLQQLSAQELQSTTLLGIEFFLCAWGRKPFDHHL